MYLLTPHVHLDANIYRGVRKNRAHPCKFVRYNRRLTMLRGMKQGIPALDVRPIPRVSPLHVRVTQRVIGLSTFFHPALRSQHTTTDRFQTSSSCCLNPVSYTKHEPAIYRLEVHDSSFSG